MIKLAKKLAKVPKAFWLVAILLAVSLFLLWPTSGWAQVDTYSVEEAGGAISKGIDNLLLYINYALGAWILIPLMNFVVDIVQYNGFLDSYAVAIGWPLVRDLSNMFFVIILLIISFSTILHISSYHYKNTLLKLVLMAILINFSKLILGFMIDFAQVVMLTFVNAFKGAAVSALSYAFGISTTGDIPLRTDRVIEPWDIFATLLLTFIFLVIAIMVMLAYIAVLLYRIISLWVLVILSPFAFFAAAFPSLKKFSSEFWSKFFSQLSTGIMLSFCMWLAFMLLAAGVAIQGQTLNQELGLTVNFESHKILWERVYTFIVAIALLLLGLQYAQQAGGFAGNFAGKIGSQLSSWGSNAVKGVAKGARALVKTPINAGINKIHELSGVDLNIPRVWKAFKTARQIKQDQQYQRGRTKAGQAMRGGGFLHSRLAAATGGISEYYQTYGYLRGIPRLLLPQLPKLLGGDIFAQGMGKAARDKMVDLKTNADEEKIKNDEMEAMKKAGGKNGMFMQSERERIQKERQQAEDKYDELSYKKTRYGEDGLDQAEKDFLNTGHKNQTADLKRQEAELDLKVQLNDLSIDDADFDKKVKEKKLELDADIKIDADALDDMIAQRVKLNTVINRKKAKDEDTEAEEQSLQQITEKMQEQEMQIRFKEQNRAKWESMDRYKADIIQKGIVTEADKHLTQQQSNKTRKLQALQNMTPGWLNKNSNNLLTDEEKEERINQIKEVDDQLKKITLELKNPELSVTVKDDLTKHQENLEKKREYLNQRDPETNRLVYLPAGDKEKDQQHFEKVKIWLAKETAKTQGELDAITLAKQYSPKLTTAEISQIETKIQEGRQRETKLRDKAGRAAPVSGYEEQQARRALEDGELKKISGTESDTELLSMFREALASNNKARMAAVVKKLANDYNDNEILNDFGYNSGSEGMRKFFEEIIRKKAGFTEQEMLALANDVSYINESRNHYNTARMATMENGRWRWYSEKEHVEVAGAEISKRSDRDIANKLNRLAYGGEDADGTFRMTGQGALILRQHVPAWLLNDRIINEHLNGSVVEKLQEAEKRDKSVSKALQGIYHTTKDGNRVLASQLFLRLLGARTGVSGETTGNTASRVVKPNYGAY